MYLYIIILLFGCNSPAAKQLKEYPDIRSAFENDEIDELQRILDFFTLQICTGEFDFANNKENESCYRQWMTKFATNEKTGDLNVEISFEKQMIFINSLESTIIRDLWIEIPPREINGVMSNGSIDLTPDGIVYKLLIELKDEYKTMDSYYNSLVASGDLSPRMVANMIVNHKKYDVSDSRIRLVIAIHYLTMNERHSLKREK